MKKLLALLLSLATVFGLAGCTSTKNLLTDLDQAAELLDEALDQLEDAVVQEDLQDTNQLYTDTYGDHQDLPGTSTTVEEDGWYYSAEDVGLYIHTYGELPDNFITKDEARDLGWEGGSLEAYAPGYVIGGDFFGNYEGLLPEEPGRTYTECDIGTLGQDSRGGCRIVFSNDGLVYYTEDHYESFVLLYGGEAG